MNEEQIIENNALIAKFEGYNEEYVDGERYFTSDYNLVFLSEEQLEYHKDWNWLMVVIDSIEDVYNLKIMSQPTLTAIQLNYKEKHYEFTHSSYSRLECLYNCVIKFINWYNTLEK